MLFKVCQQILIASHNCYILANIQFFSYKILHVLIMTYSLKTLPLNWTN